MDEPPSAAEPLPTDEDFVDGPSPPAPSTPAPAAAVSDFAAQPAANGPSLAEQAYAALRAAGGRLGGGAARHAQAGVGEGNAGDSLTTTEVASGEGDKQPWLLVELTQSARRAVQSRQWAAKASAFEAVRSWETDRRAACARTAEAQASALSRLRGAIQHGKDEDAEVVAYMQGRAAADSAYAVALGRHRLGGRVVSEAGAIRGDGSAPRAAGGCVDASLVDASGSEQARIAMLCYCMPCYAMSNEQCHDMICYEQVRAVARVLGCMTAQCSEKLARFAESDNQAKELGAAHAAYCSCCDQVLSTWRSAVTDETSRLDRGCT